MYAAQSAQSLSPQGAHMRSYQVRSESKSSSMFSPADELAPVSARRMKYGASLGQGSGPLGKDPSSQLSASKARTP